MCRTFAARLLCLASLLLLLAGVARTGWSAEEMRTWTDSTGKHKIEAKFKEVVDGKVTLARKSGGVMEIDLKKLSADDQEYIAKRLKETEDDPFKLKSDEETSADKEDMESDDNADADKPGKGGKGKSSSKRIKTVQPDWSKAENIAHAASAETWKLSVPAAPAEGAKLKARAIPIPPDVDHERPTETVISGSASHALIGSVLNGRGGGHHATHRHMHRSQTTINGVTTQSQETSVETQGGGGGPSEESAVTKLALCDLAKGKVLGTGTMRGKYIPVAVDEGGTRALMREDTFGFDEKALELWDLSSSGPKTAIRWWPACMGEKNAVVKWGAFLSDDRIVTLSKSGAMVIWKAKTGQPIAYLQIGGECDPAFTADRRYLVFGANEHIGVLDVNSAELVAEMPSERLHSASFALSPDGSRFACASFGRLTIWNFADGTRQQQIPLAGTDAGREILWPHEKYLLLGKSRVFDIENQVVLWNYQGANAAWMVGPFCMFLVNPLFNNPGALVLTTVPPPRLEQILDKAMEAPDFFVLTPGTTVKLNMDGLPDATEREKIRTALTEKLTSNGCKIGPEGTIELAATVESKSKEMAFRKLGHVPPTSAKIQSYQLQEFTTRLAFVYQGKPAWQVQTVSVPHMVRAKPGQTIEAALHETEKPNYEFLTRVGLPKKLMKPMPEAALGSSRITVAGVQ
jgi:hypothetical protein